MREDGRVNTRMRHLLAVMDQLAATQAGSIISTYSSLVVPVTVDGQHRVLKCAFELEEQQGLVRQQAWGHPMAHVFWISSGSAITPSEPLVHEPAEPSRTSFTAALMEHGDPTSHPTASDTELIAHLTATLHSSTHQPRPDTLIPLPTWFKALTHTQVNVLHELPQWAREVWATGRLFAEDLLHQPQAQRHVALHGDIHHGNILRFTQDTGSTWKFIDPKGLYGDPLFDYCNALYNPTLTLAAGTQVFKQGVDIVGKHLNSLYHADMRERFLRWVVAYGALSATWHLEDAHETHSCATELAIATLAVARQALNELGAPTS